MSLRMSLRTILLLEAALAAFCLLLGYLFPGIRYGSVETASMFFLFLALHMLIVPFKGFNFVLWDAAPNSWVKSYWFIAIGVAAFGAGHLTNAVWVYVQ